MADPVNIREGSVTSYSDQTLLKTKHNACGTRSEGDAQRTATAEWANLVDTAAKQCNEAFNGLPVNALNVSGAIHTVTRGETISGGSTVKVVLLTNGDGVEDGVEDGDWIYIEALGYAYNKSSNYMSITRHSAVFQKLDTTFDLLKSWPVDEFYPDSPGTEAFALNLSDEEDSIVAELTPGSPINLSWIIDISLRVVPGLEILLPDILPDPDPQV